MNSVAVQQVGEFLESWLAYRSRQVDIPGFSVAIWLRNDIIFSGAYGLANLETGQPMTISHLFGVGSQSKMFTAVAILQLVQQQQIGLDDAIDRYLPWIIEQNTRLGKTTIRQLLSHSAGLLRDGLDADYWQLKRSFPMVPELKESTKSGFTTGSKPPIKYSNFAYALLGQVIEAVSGTTYTQHVVNHICKSANLTQTVPDYSPAILDRLAKSYGAAYDGRRLPINQDTPRNAFASVAGSYSTAEDMCRFAANLFFGNNQLINDALKHQAFTKQAAMLHGYDKGSEFGLGFERQRLNNRELIGHSGHITGYVTATYFDPVAKLAVSVMTNAKDAPATQMAYGLFGVVDYFKSHATKPATPQVARLNTRVRNSLAAVEIVATNKRIVAIDPDDWSPFSWAEDLQHISANTLRVITPGSIFNEGEAIRFTFTKDVVQAVTYAGFTMLPEPVYRQNLLNHPEGKTLTLDDLRHTEVRIGRVVDVQKSVSPGLFRLTVDFGELGRHHACIQQLPHDDIRGQLLLGAVYPVWRSGELVKTVITLGIAPQLQSGSLVLPGSLLPLVSDPTVPETLPNHLFWDRFLDYQSQLKQNLFIFRVLPECRQEDIESPASLEAWLRGKYNKAKAILDKEAKQPAPWVEKLQQKQLKSIVRIRIIDDNPTPYGQWELEHYKRINIPLLGETIFWLPQRHIGAIGTAYNDLTVFDNSRVMVNGHKQTRLTHGTFYNRQHHDINEFLRFKQRLVKVALQKGQRLG